MKDLTMNDIPESGKILLAAAAAAPENASALRFMQTDAPSNAQVVFPSARALADTWNTDLIHAVGVGVAQSAATQGYDAMILPAMEFKDAPYRVAVSEDACHIGEVFGAMAQGVAATGMTPILHGFDRISKNAMTGDRESDLITINEAYLPALRTVLQYSPDTDLLWDKLPNNDNPITHAIDQVKGQGRFRLINTAAEEEVVHCLGAGHIVLHGDHAFAFDAYNKYISFVESEHKGTASGEDIEQLCRQGLLLNSESINRSFGNALDLASTYKRRLQQMPPAAPQEIPMQAIAEESIVLLKNERSILPLKKPRVALVGNISAFRDLPMLLADAGLEVCVVEGYCPNTDDRLSLTVDQTEQLKTCDAVLLFLDDRRKQARSTKLPANRLELLHILSSHNLPIVAIAWGAQDLDTAFDHACRALLLIRDPLPQSASALAKILTGQISPSGVLSTGYDEDTDELTRLSEENAAIAKTKARQFFGYKYSDSCGLSVKYPFGFGLSYGQIDVVSFSLNDNGAASIRLTNHSNYLQKQTLQIYAHNIDSNTVRPRNELVTFQKVTIPPKKTVFVTLQLPQMILPTYDPQADKMLQEKGRYRFLLCCSGGEAFDKIISIRGNTVKRKKESLADYLPDVPAELKTKNFLEEKELFMRNQKKITIAASLVLAACILYSVFFILLAFVGSTWLDSGRLTSIVLIALLVVSLFTCCCAIGVLISGKKKKGKLASMVDQLKSLQRHDAARIESDSVKHIFSEASLPQEEEEQASPFVTAATDARDFNYDKHLLLKDVCAGLKTFLAENGFSVGMDALRSILSAMASSKLILMRTQEQAAGNLWAGIAAYFGSYLAYTPIDTAYDEYTIFSQSEIAKNDEDSDRMRFCFYGNATADAANEYFRRLVPYFKSPDLAHSVHVGTQPDETVFTISPNTWVIVNLREETVLADLPEHIRAFAAFVTAEIESAVPTTEKTEFPLVGYYQFRTMTKDGVEKYPIDESSWKKLDHFATDLGGEFKLTNRLWQALELYAAAFMATDGNEDTMMDHLMAQRVLLYALHFFKGENAEKTIKDLIYTAFGDENIAQMLKATALLARQE